MPRRCVTTTPGELRRRDLLSDERHLVPRGDFVSFTRFCSRFGKFLKLWYGRSDNRIEGASMCHYLLEKSRIVTTQGRERNYHIFYQITKVTQTVLRSRLRQAFEALMGPFAWSRAPQGASKEEEIRWGSSSPEKFFYLRRGALEVEGVDDVKDFEDVRRAMSVVGITPTEQQFIFQTVVGVLHLGNIDFEEAVEDRANVTAATESRWVLLRNPVGALVAVCGPGPLAPGALMRLTGSTLPRLPAA